MAPDERSWGNERRHVVCWYFEASHRGSEVGVFEKRRVRHAFNAETMKDISRGRDSLALLSPFSDRGGQGNERIGILSRDM